MPKKGKQVDWKRLEREAQARVDNRPNDYDRMMNRFETVATKEKLKSAFKPRYYVGSSEMTVKRARAAIKRMKKRQAEEVEDDIVITNVPKPRRRQVAVKSGKPEIGK